ncbi:MAG: DeoR family transcriptional regulator [Candidatus Pacebacteria bacterium]|nr:DeoR family transcriptional regulator [Candidatus Paceibacterota bacterium]
MELIEITKHLYKLTLLFPKKEPLRYRVRETANNILNNYSLKKRLVSSNPGYFAKDQKTRYQEVLFEIQKDLDILFNQLEIAKYQNWASYFEVLELQQNYQKIDIENKTEIKELIFQKNNKKEPVEKLDSRKEKIIQILKEKEKIQVQDIIKILPGFSKRTIRRDFNDLIEKSIIKRIGKNNETFYTINR